MNIITWLKKLLMARASGGYLRYRDKPAKRNVLVLDNIGIRKLTSTEAQNSCEMLEERSFGESAVFTTRLPLDHGQRSLPTPVIADAIRDRVPHAAECHLADVSPSVFSDLGRLPVLLHTETLRCSATSPTPTHE